MNKPTVFRSVVNGYFWSMESVRQQKVARLLQKELSSMFQQELRHLCQGNIISVTVVRVSPDLSFAKVYLSVFPSKEPSILIDHFNEQMNEFARILYPKIRNQFRKMPEFRFYHDDSLDYAERIDEILP